MGTLARWARCSIVKPTKSEVKEPAFRRSDIAREIVRRVLVWLKGPMVGQAIEDVPCRKNATKTEKTVRAKAVVGSEI